MANIVYLLGAGASADAGCPCMQGFFESGHRLYQLGHIPQVQQEFEAIESARNALRKLSWKINFNDDNLEEVFNLLELHDYLGMEIFSTTSCQTLKSSIVLLIIAVIQATQKFADSPIDDAGEVSIFGNSKSGLRQALLGYDRLCIFVKHLQACGYARRITFITLNYDLGLEYSLRDHGIQFDYCLSSEPQPDGVGAQVRVLKLHGSFNWYSSGQGKETRIHSDDTIVSHMNNYIKAAGGIGGMRYTMFDFDKFNPKERLPFLVPPSADKLLAQGQLKRVWTEAAHALGHATVLGIFGYSMPPADQHFRMLFQLGLASDHHLRRVFLCDPNAGVRSMYRSILGTRCQIVEYNCRFDAAVANMWGDFKKLNVW